MQLLQKLKTFSPAFFRNRETEPAEAYNLWSLQYDSQPGNLMLALDEALVTGLIKDTDFTNKIIADIGCGTGRHWQKIFSKKPARLLGYDVSQGMLDRLKEKYPQAQTSLLTNNHLHGLTNESCDIIVSTLTVAHIKNIKEAIGEWARVLKHGGDMFITDYHPAALQKGGNRTFRHNNKMVAVKNYIHIIDDIREIGARHNLQEAGFVEKMIDDTVKHYYTQQNALQVFERFNGSPIIYGIHFTKA